MKSDLREDEETKKRLEEKGLGVVTEEEAKKKAAEMKGVYVECSALTQKGLRQVFDVAMKAVVVASEKSERTVVSKKEICEKRERGRGKESRITGWVKRLLV